MADTTALTFQSPPADDPYDLAPLVGSWVRSLRSRNLSPNTIKIYEHAGLQLAESIRAYRPADEKAKPIPTELDEIHREHVESHITTVLERTSPGNAHQAFRSLKTFFNWLVGEEELDRSPMRTMQPPIVPEKDVPVIPDDALLRLLKQCSGKDFESRRDTVIIMLFIDTGIRLSELTVRNVVHIDIDVLEFTVVGKGGRERRVPIGRQTTVAVDRYLRAYAKHIGRPLEPNDPLWIGVKTRRRMLKWGIADIVERRAKAAGLPHIHPHQFRHTFAHQWKLRGGNEDALMRITGWRSREMLSRYGASAAGERAREEHKKLSPSDRLYGR
ncbi:tyrosine-type recombinase/integrase [Kitasatospora sp. CB01950]|uniref:tyrosine-type recombinase/integrase n=1 Tax=Kitasatospora sp. CB01950 TaxID=1703930 RepID=UPI0009403C42|nr:tyrosine-type recombinase/integrase [Kitasatospora sp. CB01950]OKJ06794.1 integrase [Kitasatospora sp. CB01950]